MVDGGGEGGKVGGGRAERKWMNERALRVETYASQKKKKTVVSLSKTAYQPETSSNKVRIFP
jgi:hypothetical protein